MDKWEKDKLEINIDESTHKKAPAIFNRLINAVLAAIMGIIFAQIILFAFWSGSIVLWIDSPVFIVWIVFCAGMGGFSGKKFIFSLSKEGGNWWNLWNYWKF